MELLGIITIPTWLVWLCIAVVTFYLYHTWYFGYFIKLGVPGPKPKFMTGTFNNFLKKGFHSEQVKLIQKYGKIVGTYEGRVPAYLIADLDIIKSILVKDFSNFTNRRILVLRGPIKKFLFDTRDSDWKRIRQLVTPAFTSGKMRQMNDTMNSIGDTFVENMDEIAANKTIIDAKSTSGCFVMDVISAVAFGLKTNSLKNKNDPFVKEARIAFDDIITSPLVAFVLFLPHLFVPLFEYLNLTTFTSSSIKFFRKVVDAALDIRKKDSANEHVDFLKMMIDAHKVEHDHEAAAELKESGLASKTPLKGLTNDEIFGQCIGFFLAGYETTATTMGFMMYLLAITPDAQDKLIAEVEEISKTHPTPTYDTVLKMPYLDMCINETLRMYPPVPMIDREAKKDTTINGVFIGKGIVVNVPIYALHHDPEVWPDPYKFKPERFTPEAKAERNPYSYMPFGYGPRLCAGMRLAQMELKIGMTRLLQKFRFVPCEETQIPLKLLPSFFANGEKGLKIRVEKR